MRPRQQTKGKASAYILDAQLPSGKSRLLSFSVAESRFYIRRQYVNMSEQRLARSRSGKQKPEIKARNFYNDAFPRKPHIMATHGRQWNTEGKSCQNS